MKREAEDYLISDEIANLYSVILRPGLVYHDVERPWSVPFGKLSSVGSSLSGLVGQNIGLILPRGPPGTDLRILSDVTIQEALKPFEKDEHLNKQVMHHIISADDLRKK